jgi:hypothetical protein
VEDRSPKAPHGGSSASGSRAKATTVWMRIGTQAVGLVGGAKEILFTAHPSRDLVVLSIVFVVGAQAVEDIAMRVIDRIFSSDVGRQ